MEIKLHIPTETFGFAEITEEGDPEQIAKLYYEYKDAFIKIKQEREAQELLKEDPWDEEVEKKLKASGANLPRKKND